MNTLITDRVRRVTAAAVGVFEDREYATRWLASPNAALGGAVPMDLLSTARGEQLVLDELGAIEHGLPV